MTLATTPGWPIVSWSSPRSKLQEAPPRAIQRECEAANGLWRHCHPRQRPKLAEAEVGHRQVVDVCHAIPVDVAGDPWGRLLTDPQQASRSSKLRGHFEAWSPVGTL